MLSWNECRELKKEINQTLTDRLKCERVIVAQDKQGIRKEIEQLFDHLESQVPEKWKTELGLPQRAVDWWEARKNRKIGNGYFRVHRSSIPALAKLKGNALMVLLVYASRANNGDTVNDAGMKPGETFVGNDTVAKEAGVSVGYVHRAIKELQEMGFLVKVRKHPRTGTWIRRVVMDPLPQAEEDQVQDPVAEPKPEGGLPRIVRGDKPSANRAESYDGWEWENFSSSPDQTQAGPPEGLAEDEQTHGGRTLKTKVLHRRFS